MASRKLSHGAKNENGFNVMNRANLQPGLENFERSMSAQRDQLQAVVEASSHRRPVRAAGSAGAADAHRPGRAAHHLPLRHGLDYRADATAAHEEVVRLGRVRRVAPDRVVLAQGSVAADPDTLYSDCSATAIMQPPAVPIFDGGRINLAAAAPRLQELIAEMSRQAEMA